MKVVICSNNIPWNKSYLKEIISIHDISRRDMDERNYNFKIIDYYTWFSAN